MMSLPTSKVNDYYVFLHDKNKQCFAGLCRTWNCSKEISDIGLFLVGGS